eukprot:g2851.t1
MDGETMQKSFDDILNGKGDHKKDFEITTEEARKFKAAMADPEFQSMLRDYMEEMQDPKYRAEQEEYICELEGRNEVPEGKETVHPAPGFVIKTKFTKGSADAVPEKLFVNVVTSDKLGKPYSKASSARPGGEAWSLPVAVGPPRIEMDKAGRQTTAVDVCYHPEALVRAQRLDAFRDLVALSSLERVEDVFLRSKQQKITVDKNYRILKGVKYKSGNCSILMVAKADINRTSESESAVPAPGSGSRSGATTNTRGNGNANAPKGGSAVPRSAAAESKAAARGSREDTTGEASSEQPLPPGLKRGSGGTTYKLVESGAFDIADHTSDRVKQRPMPQTIVATVTLPANAEPTRKLDLLVSTRRLTIGVLGDPEGSSPRYLDVSLPYDVEDDSKCSAVRDKTGVLKITMPVKPPVPPAPAPKPPAAPASSVPSGDGGGGGGDDDGEAADDGAIEEHKGGLSTEGTGESDRTDNAESKGASSDTALQRKPDHSRWVADAPESEALDKPWEALPGGQEKGAISTLPPPPPRAQAEADAEARSRGIAEREEKELEEQLGEDKDKDFVPCDRFIKKVRGYEFKTGLKGCGYYRDDKNTKVPVVAWNETVKTMCGVVEVPDIVDDSVHFVVAGNKMVLSFDAEAPGETAGCLERYRTEMVLPGGVAADKCSHDTAADNLVVKLAKAPECEWGSSPTPTKAAQVASAIDKIVAGGAGVASAPASPAREDERAESASAPGYEGTAVPAPALSPEDIMDTIAYQLD